MYSKLSSLVLIHRWEVGRLYGSGTLRVPTAQGPSKEIHAGDPLGFMV